MIALMLAVAIAGQDAKPVDTASAALGACLTDQGEKLAPHEGSTPQVAQLVMQACAAQEGAVMALVRKNAGADATEAEVASKLGIVKESIRKLAVEIVTAERKP